MQPLTLIQVVILNRIYDLLTTHDHNMPFKSVKQRKYMFANLPELAKKWAHKYGSGIKRSSPRLKRKK